MKEHLIRETLDFRLDVYDGISTYCYFGLFGAFSSLVGIMMINER